MIYISTYFQRIILKQRKVNPLVFYCIFMQVFSHKLKHFLSLFAKSMLKMIYKKCGNLWLFVFWLHFSDQPFVMHSTKILYFSLHFFVIPPCSLLLLQGCFSTCTLFPMDLLFKSFTSYTLLCIQK